MSWTPKLLVAAGSSTAQGITGGTLLSIGGIFGAALLGGLAARFRLERVLALFMLLTAALLALFAERRAARRGLAAGTADRALRQRLRGRPYALAPSLYDASVRATGVGWGSASVAAGDPLAAGGRAPLDDGWQPLSSMGRSRRCSSPRAAVLPLLGARRRERSPTLGDAARAAGVSALGGDDRLGDGGAEPVQRRRAFAALVPVQGDVERRQGEGQFEMRMRLRRRSDRRSAPAGWSAARYRE